MKVVLISTYELGHQPFGLASPNAWLARDGHDVTCLDLAVCTLDEAVVARAGLVAFYLPMHTATRLALPVIERVSQLNPSARLAAYGLYAPLNRELLTGLGVNAIISGEFEPALTALANERSAPERNLDRLQFLTPDRAELPVLSSYARLRQNGTSKVVGYTEASRGCKHTCRHCPVVPVYEGQFRIVQPDVVLNDIRQQVAAGAQHITFGDPDFFNGPAHAIRIVEALHAEFPALTYDATIKIEHLKKHRRLLEVLRNTGCLFVTSAVESIDNAVLEKLKKNHTREDFVTVVSWMREAGLSLHPTFIAFHPWTTLQGYGDLLGALVELELVENTPPVQLALRLLIPQGSKLLDLAEIRSIVGPFDSKALVFPWVHPDRDVDALGARVFRLAGQQKNRSRAEVFAEIWKLAGAGPLPSIPTGSPVPYTMSPGIAAPSRPRKYDAASPVVRIHDRLPSP